MDFKKTLRRNQEYYYYTVDLGKTFDKDGHVVRNRKRLYAKTKKELEAKIDESKRQFTEGLPEKVQYFNIASEEWIKTFFMRDGTLKKTTKAMYIAAWKKYITKADFYNLPIGLVTAAKIQSYYNALHDSGVKSSALKKAHNLLRHFYRYVDITGIGKNVTISLKVPKDNKITKDESEIVTWSDDELKKIINGFSSADSRFRMKFLIILLKNTGLRMGEALAVSKNDIDDDGLHIRRQISEDAFYKDKDSVSYIPHYEDVKTDRSRRLIPLNSEVKCALQEHLQWQIQDAIKHGYREKLEDGRLFTTITGNLYSPRNVRRALERYYAQIGVVPKPPHTYRHTFGTNLCRNGVSIEVCSKLMGHENIVTTAKYYVGVSRDQKQAAVDCLIVNTKPKENKSEDVAE